VIGMISGTSYDAVEALLVDLELEGDVLVCDLLGHRSVPYSDEVRESVAAMLPPALTTIEQVCRLDVAIGVAFGDIARQLGDESGAGRVDAVCSHGQTVFHWVEGAHARGTLQLGEPAWIAERTGVTVVSDVRNRDIAAGGHGAPLASLLDVLLLGERQVVTGALNLGGIANVTVLGAGREPLAFDIGPANALIDAVVTSVTGGAEHFDRDGARAGRGSVDEALFAALVDDPYFELPSPKSTGKEYFHLGYVEQRLGGQRLEGDDLVATVTAASAEIIAADLRRLGVTEVVASGGGTRNPTFMAELATRLEGVNLRRFDELGVPEYAKEALVFAIIGFLTLAGLPATVPSCTGAAKASVLGSITPGDAGLPSIHATTAPRLLRVRTPLLEAVDA
jgi:anhydro-N-acetylmuramic acid kinase